MECLILWTKHSNTSKIDISTSNKWKSQTTNPLTKTISSWSTEVLKLSMRQPSRMISKWDWSHQLHLTKLQDRMSINLAGPKDLTLNRNSSMPWSLNHLTWGPRLISPKEKGPLLPHRVSLGRTLLPCSWALSKIQGLLIIDRLVLIINHSRLMRRKRPPLLITFSRF